MSLRRNCSYLALFAVSFPVFAAMATVFFYPHIFTGLVGRKILLVVPADTLYRTSIIYSSTVLPLNPFVNLALAPLSLFLTYGQDLGVGPTVGSPRSSSAPPSLGRNRVVPPQLKTSNGKKLSSHRIRTCSLRITGLLLYPI